jgi:hypothetical protein
MPVVRLSRPHSRLISVRLTQRRYVHGKITRGGHVILQPANEMHERSRLLTLRVGKKKMFLPVCTIERWNGGCALQTCPSAIGLAMKVA